MEQRDVKLKEDLFMDGSVKVSAQIMPFGHMTYLSTGAETSEEEQQTPIYVRQKTTYTKQIEIRF